MYISNITHFLDETGNIPKHIHKEGREMGNYLALIIDATTKTLPIKPTAIEVRCITKKCEGMIQSELLEKTGEIHWICPVCSTEGKISGWNKTKWDNS